MPASRKDNVYSEADVLEAVAEIKNKSLTYRQAFIKYGVPISTLCDKIKERRPIINAKPGPNTFLSQDQEDRLVDWLIAMAKIAYGVTRRELPTIVKEVLDQAEKDGLQTEDEQKFKNNRPSSCWVYGFLKRHPHVSCRIPENLGYQRGYITEAEIREWFGKLESFLLDEFRITAKDFFCEENRDRIFNLDESGFPLQGTNGKFRVLTKRGTKNLYRLAPDTKEQVTVLACVSARGIYTKPFVIYPGLRLPKFNYNGVDPDEFDVGYTPNGWISTDSFFGWLSNLFYPTIKDTTTFPIILFMDGHTSHINLAVSDFCREHDIILFCFPPHSSHVLQPLDVTVFGPLKKFWNESIKNFKDSYKVPMNRSHFFPVFFDAWNKAKGRPENAIAGFRATGLLPFNPNNVDYSKLLDQQAIRRWELQRSLKKTPEQEKVGIIRCLKVVETKLSEDMKTLFESRYEEGYDVNESTPSGVLWSIYKAIKEMAEACDKPDDAIENVPRSSHNTTPSNSNVLTPTEEYDSTADNLPSTSLETRAASLEESTLNLERTTPVKEATKTITTWEISPFKRYLKISDTLILTRKVRKVKPKTPPAISGRDYHKNLLKQQEQKAKEIQEKAKRKSEREKKREMKQKEGTKKKRKIEEPNSSTDEEFIASGSSEDNGGEEFEEGCGACDGKERWEENDIWIGCNRCSRWYHRYCLSEDIEQMSIEEVKKFNYICRFCECWGKRTKTSRGKVLL